MSLPLHNNCDSRRYTDARSPSAKRCGWRRAELIPSSTTINKAFFFPRGYFSFLPFPLSFFHLAFHQSLPRVWVFPCIQEDTFIKSHRRGQDTFRTPLPPSNGSKACTGSSNSTRGDRPAARLKRGWVRREAGFSQGRPRGCRATVVSFCVCGGVGNWAGAGLRVSVVKSEF